MTALSAPVAVNSGAFCWRLVIVRLSLLACNRLSIHPRREGRVRLVQYALESGGHSVFLLTYHLVWCVKYRRRVLVDDVAESLKAHVARLLREADCPLVAVETDLDHIHVVFRTRPTHQLSKLVNSLNGVTARMLLQEFPEVGARLWRGHLWSPSYFVVTVGGVPLEVIRQYVETQGERRR
jgi:putative transposase